MYVISFSGGLGSAVSTLAAHEKGLPFQAVFADTLVEDDDLYRFMVDVMMTVQGEAGGAAHRILQAWVNTLPPLKEKRRRKVWLEMIGRMLEVAVPRFHYLQDGRTPWDVFVDKRWVGNTRTAHCSDALKTEHVARWCEDNVAPEDPLVLGMDWSELDRIERAAAKWAPRPVVSLLNELRVERPEYDLILNRYGIAKPRLYGWGFSHNNCAGGCVKAGLKQWAQLWKMNPEAFRYFEQELNDTMVAIGDTAKPFLRKTENKVLHYITLTELRERLEAGTIKVPEFDAEGCGCFTD